MKKPQKKIYEMEKNDLPYKEFKIMLIKRLIELGRRMDKVKTSTKRENIRKYKQKSQN